MANAGPATTAGDASLLQFEIVNDEPDTENVQPTATTTVNEDNTTTADRSNRWGRQQPSSPTPGRPRKV